MYLISWFLTEKGNDASSESINSSVAYREILQVPALPAPKFLPLQTDASVAWTK